MIIFNIQSDKVNNEVDEKQTKKRVSWNKTLTLKLPNKSLKILKESINKEPINKESKKAIFFKNKFRASSLNSKEEIEVEDIPGGMRSIVISKRSSITSEKEEKDLKESTELDFEKIENKIKNRTKETLILIEKTHRKNQILLRKKRTKSDLAAPSKSMKLNFNFEDKQFSPKKLKAVKSMKRGYLIKETFQEKITKQPENKTLNDEEYFKERYMEMKAASTFPNSGGNIKNRPLKHNSLMRKNSPDKTLRENKRSSSAKPEPYSNTLNENRLKTPLIGNRFNKEKEVEGQKKDTRVTKAYLKYHRIQQVEREVRENKEIEYFILPNRINMKNIILKAKK